MEFTIAIILLLAVAGAAFYYKNRKKFNPVVVSKYNDIITKSKK